MMRFLLAFLLCLAAATVFADQAMRPEQFPGRSWSWTGAHNNVPRQTLTVSGTTFTPPSSFGNYWITTSAASQTIACPTSISDGDTMNFHIQQGASAPFSPNISFANPCYSFAGGPPTLSTAANAVDDFFCFSQSPADVTGASVVCGWQLAVSPTNKVRVQGSAGTYKSGITSTTTWTGSAILAGQTVLCMNVVGGSASDPTGVTDGAGNTLTKLSPTATLFSGNNASLWYKIGTVANSAPTFTATLAAAAAGQMSCDVYSGITSQDGYNVAAQTNPAANAATVSIATTFDGNLIYGANASSGTTTSAAGAGFTIRISDAQSTSYHMSSEDQIQATHNASTPVPFNNAATANGVVTFGVGLH